MLYKRKLLKTGRANIITNGAPTTNEDSFVFKRHLNYVLNLNTAQTNTKNCRVCLASLSVIANNKNFSGDVYLQKSMVMDFVCCCCHSVYTFFVLDYWMHRRHRWPYSLLSVTFSHFLTAWCVLSYLSLQYDVPSQSTPDPFSSS